MGNKTGGSGFPQIGHVTINAVKVLTHFAGKLFMLRTRAVIIEVWQKCEGLI